MKKLYSLNILLSSLLAASLLTACNSGGAPDSAMGPSAAPRATTQAAMGPSAAQRGTTQASSLYQDELNKIKQKTQTCDDLLSEFFKKSEPTDINQYDECLKNLTKQKTDFTAQIKTDAGFQTESVNSFYFYNTQSIPKEERFIHRIWLGSAPNDSIVNMINTWGKAIDLVNKQHDYNQNFQQPLWVWDLDQLGATQENFKKKSPYYQDKSDSDAYEGMYFPNGMGVDKPSIAIFSLKKIVEKQPAEVQQAIKVRLEKKQYALLSDYFRGLILEEFGGLYVDVDIAPTSLITMFLTKPELPNYRSGAKNQQNVTMFALNGAAAGRGIENGILAGLKNNPALKEFVIKADEAIINGTDNNPQLIFKIWGDVIQPHLTAFTTKAIIFGEDVSKTKIYNKFNNQLACLGEMEKNNFNTFDFQLAQYDENNACHIQTKEVNDIVTLTQIPSYNSWDRENYSTKEFHNMKELNNLYEGYVQEQYLRSSQDENFWWDLK